MKLNLLTLSHCFLLSFCKSGNQKWLDGINKKDGASLWTKISNVTNMQAQDDLSLQLSRAEDDVFTVFNLFSFPH